MPVSDSHFVLLLPSSLVLTVAPVIDAGSTQPPSPALTAWNVFGMQPVLYGSAELSPTSSRRPPRIQLIIAAVRKKQGIMPQRGAHESWRLAGASRWNVSDADLGAGGRHEGAHWGAHVRSGAVAPIGETPANPTITASWCLNGVGQTLAMAFAMALHGHLPFSLFPLSP
ncbi:hypothetical protein B0H14DRAFT_2648083 [Mycena olivaceomarginata]|nr:hypothetical protein B0H14DRAFT_2648083 [Mycena olivaceomarginata]